MSESDENEHLFSVENGSKGIWGLSPIPGSGPDGTGNKIYETPLARKQSSLHDLRAPWVPAPAKTSSQTNIIYSRKTRYSLPAQHCDSNHEMKISEMSVPTPQTSLSSISESGFLGNNPSSRTMAKKASSNTLTRHKLQSKDSFVDVTSCLTRKRHRIMKLWEDNISSTNTELLEHLEQANKYGQEAANRIEKLKALSYDMKKGSIKDVKALEPMRDEVIESLKKFEDSNKFIQAILSEEAEELKSVTIPMKCSPAGGDRSDNIDLSTLNKMYAESFSLANNFTSTKSTGDCKRLEEKIVEQHQTIKSLESELKRVESQCTFDFRLLKSSLHEKLDDLNGFPEILHITEMKLAQCMSRIAILEKTVHDKEAENSKLSIELNVNKSKVETLFEKLRSDDCENSQLKGRLKELEAVNLSFRKNSSTEVILKTIESKLELMKAESSTTKIEELEEKLKLAKKHIQHQRRAKEDVTSRLTRRVEELMEALDESRQKNHILRNQLRFIRTSYHNLFPLNDIFGSDDPIPIEGQDEPRGQSQAYPQNEDRDDEGNDEKNTD